MQYTINRVAVLGSGVMGAAIAAHIAGAGISVSLLDIVPANPDAKQKAKGLTKNDKTVRNAIAQSGKDRVLDSRNHNIYDKSLGDLITVGNFEDDMNFLADCDWIIEAVVERLDIKRDLFAKIDAVRKPNAVISTNTSGLSINTMIETMPQEFRQQFIGTHFFNPPRHMKLVELVPSKDTKPELIDFMEKFMTDMLGKVVVRCKDTPGFVANRVGTFFTVSVLQMLDRSDFNMAELDAITGVAMGRPKTATFGLVDMVGLDIPIFVAQNIIDNVNDDIEKAAFQIPGYHQKLVEKGHLGNKSNQGFFKRSKNENGTVILMWDDKEQEYGSTQKRTLGAVESALREKSAANKLRTLVYSDEPDGKMAWDILKALLLYAAEKAEEITNRYTDIDLAMKHGYNWTLGPFEAWDAIGFEKSVARMKTEGETIPTWIEERLTKGERIFAISEQPTKRFDINNPSFPVVKENDDAVLYNMGDGVLCLSFTTKSNTISEDVMDMMGDAVQIVEQGYKGLVIANGGGKFSAGANLSSPTGFAKDLDLAATERKAFKLQKANMALKYAKRPVVAVPMGMTLGGGAEIVMHTRAAVAAAETYMGLVEVGVGLAPAGGGIKELLVRYMQYADMAHKDNVITFVQAVWELIAMGKTSGSAIEAQR